MRCPMSTLDATVEKVNSFRKLPVGWDYGADGPASGLAVIGALGILYILKNGGVSDFDSAAGRNGSVTVVGLANGREVELSCRPNGRYDVLFYEDDDCLVYENRTVGQTVELLRGNRWLNEKSSTSCILNGIYLMPG